MESRYTSLIYRQSDMTNAHPNGHSQNQTYRIARAMLLVAAAIFLLFSLLYNEFILGLFIRDLGIMPRTIPRIREVRVYFALWGIALVLQSECVRRVPWLKEFFNNSLVMNIFLATLTSTVLIVALEFSLRPFAYLPGKATTLFVKDDVLGWKLRPNASDLSRKARVRINSKGMRGPELPYAKQAHIKRILYVGDSVTFGFGLEDEQIFPFRVQTLLKRMLEDSIETVNAGVDGYSPWQEYEYLKSEGLRYQPNLVVVSFVLNDVTEKGWLDRWQFQSTGDNRSTPFDELVTRSNVLYFVRIIGAMMRFGSNVQQGALKAQTLYIGHLTNHPDRPEVHKAWEAALEDLGEILSTCKEHHIPVILVVFPFAFQLDNVKALSAPQRIVCNFARKDNIPVIDLLPVLDEHIKARGTKPEDYFLDELHPSALGSSLVADTLANFIRTNRLLFHN
jgi:lysophospholipase L1-like esterase